MVHLCLCGCGKKVVTPLSPTGWRMTFDGKTISVHPSIGNWNLACRSHYWISGGRVEWADTWDPKRSDAGFARDAQLKGNYHRDREAGGNAQSGTSPQAIERRSGGNWWTRL